MATSKKHNKTYRPILTVDGVLVIGKKILLVKRNFIPFRGYWVLPGGHVEYGETTKEALKREMKEELGIEIKAQRLIGVYSDPKRDPRGHRVTVAYQIKKIRGNIRLNREASEYQFFSLKALPKRIGFDHRFILKDVKNFNHGYSYIRH